MSAVLFLNLSIMYACCILRTTYLQLYLSQHAVYSHQASEKQQLMKKVQRKVYSYAIIKVKSKSYGDFHQGISTFTDCLYNRGFRKNYKF